MCRHACPMSAGLFAVLQLWIKATLIFSPKQAGLVSIHPDTLDNGTRVKMECKAPLGIVNVKSLRIERKDKGQTNWTIVVTAHVGHMQGQAVFRKKGNAILDRSHAVVNGSLSQGFVSLTLNRDGCADGGNYTCWGQGLNNTTQLYEDFTRWTVSFRVIPGPLTLTSDMDVNQGLTEGSVVMLTCSGVIGTFNNETQVYLDWQYTQKSGDSSFSNTSDKGLELIQQSTSMSFQSICPDLRQGIWTLRRTLSVEDSGRLYRCHLRVGSEIRDASIVLGAVSIYGKEISTTTKATVAGSVLGVVVIVGLVVAALLLRRHLSLGRQPGTQALGQGRRSGLPPPQQLRDVDTQRTDPSPCAITTVPSPELVKRVSSEDDDVIGTSPSRSSFMHINTCYGDFAPIGRPYRAKPDIS